MNNNNLLETQEESTEQIDLVESFNCEIPFTELNPQEQAEYQLLEALGY